MSRRAGFLALTVAIAVGLVAGLVYAWLIDPVEHYNTSPALLRDDYRHVWVRLAALGYVADGDLQRALTRLEEVEKEDVHTALSALIEAYAAQGKPAEAMRSLSWLAEQAGVYTPAMLIYLGTPPPSPTPPSPPTTPPPVTALPTATATPTPFFSPLPVPSPYRVVSQTLLCEGAESQLQVLLRAAPGEEGEGTAPLAGIVLWLTWPGGADRAITGLRPHIAPGYADFTLQPDVLYALSIGDLGAPILSGLAVRPCPAAEGEELRPGSWQIVVEAQE